MSFSKAKITRFNEVVSCAPPPGAYDPKFEIKVPGTIIPQSERFIDIPSPAGSVVSEPCSVKSSTNATTFRTPTVVCKKKTQASKSNRKLNFITNNNENQLELLQEKIVECENKTQSIVELEKQIEEQTETICTLKKRITELEDESVRIDEECREKLRSTVLDHEIFLKDLEQKHRMEIDATKADLTKLKLLLRSFKNFPIVVEALHVDRNELRKKFTDLQSINGNVVKEMTKCLETIRAEFEAQKRSHTVQLDGLVGELNLCKAEHAKEIESMKEKHRDEIEDLEYGMLDIVTNLRKKIEVREAEKETEIKKIKKESEEMLQRAEENACERLKLLEIQMEEKCNQIELDGQMKLREQEMCSDAILKECQAIGESYMMKAEFEKKDIVAQLEKANRRVHELYVENQNLAIENVNSGALVRDVQKKFSAVVVELNDVRAKHDKQISELFIELEKAHNDKRKYAITLDETRATVEVLKKRLVDSDKDVLQLKNELSELETAKLEVDAICAELKDRTDELSREKRSYDETIRSLVEDVRKTEKKLTEDIDRYKSSTVVELELKNKRLRDDLESVTNQLEVQRSMIAKAQSLLKEAEEKIDGYRECDSTVERLQEENKELKRRSKSDEQSYNELLNEYNKAVSKNAELEKCVEMHSLVIRPFKDKVKSYEEEKQELLKRQLELEKIVAETKTKYAELLGHHNTSQKIKHLIDLKNTNLELSKKNHELDQKVRTQSKTIEKLKSDITKFEDKGRYRKPKNGLVDKENMSPGKPLITSADSSSLTPLRERNSTL